jgi:hypothetical protein
MKVFISWSGELSKKVAELISIWLPDTLQGIKTWISSEDIDKGAIWFNEIAGTLSETNFGIICLTSDNINNPWILFEAGALSKGLSKNKVCPLLVNLSATNLKPPISQFNCVLPTKSDLYKMLKSINNEQDTGRLTEERLEKTFDRWWEVFEKEFKKILSEFKPEKTIQQRATNELLEEILESTRAVQRGMHSIINHDESLKNILKVTSQIGARDIYDSDSWNSKAEDLKNMLTFIKMMKTNVYRSGNHPTRARFER